MFCTTAEGIKGKRAKEWGLVDHVVSRSKWDDTVAERAKALAAKVTVTRGPAIELPALDPEIGPTGIRYRYVDLKIDPANRTGELAVRGPATEAVVDLTTPSTWSLQAFRELDDALLHLRFDFPEIGMVTVRTVGDPKAVVLHDDLLAQATTGLAREIRLQRRVLKRFDNTALVLRRRGSRRLVLRRLAPRARARRGSLPRAIDADEKIGVTTSTATPAS